MAQTRSKVPSKAVVSKRATQPVGSKEVKLTFTHAEIAKAKKKLVQATNSVDDVEVVHLLSYLTADERISFINELYRVMKSGAKCSILTPYWASGRAYTDLRMQYPPVVEGWYFNLNADYRKQDPGGDKRYKCDFDATWGYTLHPAIVTRNHEYQQHAVTFWKEAAQDLAATIIKK
jgi:hypothetical protein